MIEPNSVEAMTLHATIERVSQASRVLERGSRLTRSSEHAVEDDDSVAGEVHAVAADRGAHEAAAGREACKPVRSSRPRRSDQNGASAVWALPVTGSSGMPSAGAKKNDFNIINEYKEIHYQYYSRNCRRVITNCRNRSNYYSFSTAHAQSATLGEPFFVEEGKVTGQKEIGPNRTQYHFCFQWNDEW